MTKAEIRKNAMLERKGLSEVEVVDYSRRMLLQFSGLDFSDVKTVHVFLPIVEKREPDTFLFIEWLQEAHPEIRILVPRADFDTALMTHHVYSGTADLQKNLYNILEPQKSEIHTGDIDLVLVPLLAFDRLGYRVGYGKGFYDRFLQPIQTRKIGLSFFEPVDRIDDVDENDVGLDACITPQGIIEF
jgi:5-formyltetrahydrofolate cyclo-ligase